MKENRFKTQLPELMIGYYTAEDVRRSWQEEFVDEDSGSIIPATRSELIIERGTYIDADVASSLSFHIQAGDIDGVDVTDVKRSAKPLFGNHFSPWKAVAVVSGKAVTLILYAKYLEQATAIAREYIERTREGGFTLQSVQTFKDCIFVEHEFSKEEQQDRDGNPIERAFYQLDTATVWKADGDYASPGLFLVLAKDVDEAKELVEDCVRGGARSVVRSIIEDAEREKEESGRDVDVATDHRYIRYSGDFEVRILSGTKIPCSAIVPLEFSKEFDTDNAKEGEEE